MRFLLNFADMKKILFGCAMCAMLASCGDADEFEVKVDSPGIGTQLMTVAYTIADGNRVVNSFPAVDGKFEFKGASAELSIVEIFTSNKQLYATLIATNGDKIALYDDKEGNKRVEGSELSAQLMQLVATYNDTSDYTMHPAIVQQALREIYASAIRSDTAKFVSPELYIGRDSTKVFETEGIWVFTSSAEERTTELLDTLRKYHGDKRKVRDVWVGNDTSLWRAMTRSDSAKWAQAMLPDAPLQLKAHLRSTPVIIEVDSTGNVVRVQSIR